ncbi:hypothetical protein HanPI659440_Chr14g0546951 [Helianthus annuus]|nr:hypothetical protein HanPI659440_Chr14g0546951 [Helianthus annuus]
MVDPIGAIVLAVYTIVNSSGTVKENAGSCCKDHFSFYFFLFISTLNRSDTTLAKWVGLRVGRVDPSLNIDECKCLTL